ncbi:MULTISPECIES: lipoprotein insertase outer membrane protein LolB [Thermomonas]|jgi:outer membrane lipoprotein LolB|uniref:lipoprotein insertase outer membrane protein LolB n=1 Tax=Thermomonas TaxID=141948 RepID=UPI00042A48C6|nr:MULTISPECIES: lipoprotein insertase outer membrane protein LolB [Thermomonas]
MRPAAGALLALALAGCATLPRPVASGDVLAGDAAQRVRTAALGLAGGDCAAPAWSLVGRVALSNGRQGGSGRIEWTQAAGAQRLQLSAPVTRQSWVLEVDGGGAVLQGVAETPLRDSDPARLLREATGWDIPVAALGCWVRGAAAAAAGLGPARIAYGLDLLPRRIEQGGWTVEYDGWNADAGGLPLPGKVEARRGEDRVRLVIDQWAAE